MNALRSPLCVALIAMAMLGSCAAPDTNDTVPIASDSHAPSEQATDTRAPKPTPASPSSDKRPMRKGGPLPPERGDPDAAPVAIDSTCETDADCTVKNVGNCCGYFPACVSADSPTDPQGVQARCAKHGMVSTCGFQEITACSCRQGRCEAESSQVVQ